jgi:GAF domain-containing protein
MSNQDDAERARQSELDDFRIVDTLEDQAFDDLTRMAASVCGVPIALISLLDRDRQWFKSRVGLQATETPREFAFCEHAIHAPEPVMMVRDATQDERFAANPLVTGDPGIRFYAGAPLVSSGGQRLGTICVIDRVPRELDARQLETLQFLADQVMRKLEERRQALAAGGPAP